MSKKYNIFHKGDVIRTNPEPGFYGIAVVLNDGEKIEVSPGKMSYPLCHIGITPLLYQFEVSFEDIDINLLKPLIFTEYFDNKGTSIFWREKVCIDIYTNRNKANLSVIGNIEPSLVYNEELIFKPLDDRFFLCGDVNSFLGREAYINWIRKNG